MSSYDEYIEECKAIIIESVFTSKWALIEGYHEVGRLTCEAGLEEKGKDIAKQLKISVRTFQRCAQFYKSFPDLNRLPEGKNISWHRICNRYLPRPRERVEEEPVVISYGDLKNKILENIDWLVETAKETKDGWVMFLPHGK